MALTAPTRVRRAPAAIGSAGLRTPLKVAAPPPSSRRQPWRRVVVASVVLALGSLLLVVGAQAYLISGQVRLVQVQQELNTQLGRHRNLDLRVAQLEEPSRIVAQAQKQGYTVPAQVNDLPRVDLSPSEPAAPSGASSTSVAP
jgi:hypothetical protein